MHLILPYLDLKLKGYDNYTKVCLGCAIWQAEFQFGASLNLIAEWFNKTSKIVILSDIKASFGDALYVSMMGLLNRYFGR